MKLYSDWSETGANVYQISLAMWCYEWILRESQTNAQSDEVVLPIFTVTGSKVVDCSRFLSKSIEYQTQGGILWDGTDKDPGPPPPPPLLQTAGSSSSSAGPAAARWILGDAGWQQTFSSAAGAAAAARDAEVEEGIATYPRIQWAAGGKTRKWRDFEEPWQTQLLAFHRAFPKGVYDIDWNGNGEVVTRVNFEEMEQVNRDTGFERKIRFVPGAS